MAGIRCKLREVGLTPPIYHRALVEQQHERDEVRAELEQTRLALAAFQGLPASLPGAEAALRRLEAEYQNARRELDQKLTET